MVSEYLSQTQSDKSPHSISLKMSEQTANGLVLDTRFPYTKRKDLLTRTAKAVFRRPDFMTLPGELVAFEM